MMFVPTIHLRRDTYGSVSSLEGRDESWRSLTDLGLMFATAWYLDNPIRTRFILQMNPTSVEQGNWKMAYASYPPAFVAPVYLASLILRRPPTIELLMNISLIAHLILALILGLITIELIETAGGTAGQGLLLGVTASAMILYLPAPLLYFQNVWWPDSAGLPCFAAVLYLERNRKYPKTQLAILLLGCLTDWLNLILGAVIVAKRLLLKDDRGRRASTLPMLAVMSLFVAFMAWYENLHSSFQEIYNKLSQRSGALRESGSTWSDFVAGYWGRTFPSHYGIIGLVVLMIITLASLFYIIARSRKRIASSAAFKLLFLAIVPMLLHATLLKQHYYHHPYNNLKFAIPFSLLPAALFVLLKPLFRRRSLCLALAAGGPALLLFLLFPIFEIRNQLNGNLPPEVIASGLFLRHNTDYRDIVFSSDQPIDPKTPAYRTRSEFLAVSYKYVWLATDISAIQASVRKLYLRRVLPAAHRLSVFGFRSNEKQLLYWKKFASAPEIFSADGNYYLIPLDPKFYLPFN